MKSTHKIYNYGNNNSNNKATAAVNKHNIKKYSNNTLKPKKIF